MGREWQGAAPVRASHARPPQERMKTKTTLIAAMAALALAAGCGDDDDGNGAGQETGGDTFTTQAETPESAALGEIDEVRELLDRGVQQYRVGDEKAAERTVGDAYLEHFEDVEHPLEERDHELMESLEKLISTTIRDRIKQGADPSEVERLVDQANRDLDRAEALLR